MSDSRIRELLKEAANMDCCTAQVELLEEAVREADARGWEETAYRARHELMRSAELSGNGDRGLQIREGSSGIRVEQSAIEGNVSDGLRARDSSSVDVVACTASGNGGDGLEMRDVTGSRIEGCTAGANVEYGIRLRDSEVVRVDNNVSGNGQGDVRID